MKKVEIYNEYKELLNGQGTVVQPASGFVAVVQDNLDENSALDLVAELYEEAKILGTYTDKIVKLNEGYAELSIIFPDGRELNRVIYTV